MGKHIFTVIVAVVVGASLLGYLFTYQVRSDEVAVVLTFGKMSDKLPEPGLGFRWPWPIQEVRRFDNRMHVHEMMPVETLMADELNIIVHMCVCWRIGDIQEFNRNFGRADDPIALAWDKLQPIIRDRVNQVLGQSYLRDLVSNTGEGPKYDAFEEKTRMLAEPSAMNDYGIDLMLLKIRRLELPSSVSLHVYDRMKAERQKEARAITQDGRAQAEGIKSRADSQASQIRELAEAEAVRIRSEGEAEAAKYYKVFAENPELHIFLRKIDALEKVAEENTTFIMDTTMPPFDILQQQSPRVETE